MRIDPAVDDSCREAQPGVDALRVLIASLWLLVGTAIPTPAQARRKIHKAPLGSDDPSTWTASFPEAVSATPMTYFEIPADKDGQSFTLYAWLSTPSGRGPFPTVLLLHGCNGLFGHSSDGTFIGAWPQYEFWSDWLVDKGYATLRLESFTGRGFDQLCGDPSPLSPGERANDVFAAASYLDQIPRRVDSNRIFAMGDSHGGATVMQAADLNNPLVASARESNPALIDGYIALYPGCAGLRKRNLSDPVLLMIGSADDWTSPTECERLTGFPIVHDSPVAFGGAGAYVTLVVYTDATHAFDVAGPPKVTPAGHRLIYDPAATADAQERISDFLTALGGP